MSQCILLRECVLLCSMSVLLPALHCLGVVMMWMSIVAYEEHAHSIATTQTVSFQSAYIQCINSFAAWDRTRTTCSGAALGAAPTTVLFVSMRHALIMLRPGSRACSFNIITERIWCKACFLSLSVGCAGGVPRPESVPCCAYTRAHDAGISKQHTLSVTM